MQLPAHSVEQKWCSTDTSYLIGVTLPRFGLKFEDPQLDSL